MVLTGANGDGAQGLKKIKSYGGVAIVQNPETAKVRHMPKAALAATAVDHIVNLDQLVPLLLQLNPLQKEKAYGATH